nr:phenylacetate--CoA ligase [bacterium]
MPIFNPEIECAKESDIASLQLERLKASVQYAYDHVAHVREKCDAAHVGPGDIHKLSDIQKFPFTVKDEMREAYPYGLFAVPMRDIVRLHASSGTTGRHTVVGYTRKDLDIWTECVARVASAGGATADDIAQISFGYGLFTGGFGLHYGLEKIGAAVVPVSSGNTQRQINLMRDFGSTVLVSTPSYALYMAEAAEQMDAMKDIKLRVGLFGGEGSTEEMRAAIEKKWGMLATENYGLSEIIGPGVAGECPEKCGMHIAEDHFLLEIINPETGEVLPDGEWGELVITTLTREAVPMIRYRTRDISCIMRGKCACGRTSARIAKIRGRSDDMLIVRGVNIFPSQIESVLMSTPGIGPHYEIVVGREKFLDTLEVKVELSDASLLERFSELERLRERIRSRLKSTILVDARVTLVEPSTLKRFEGKAQRVTDLRKG